VRWSCQNHSRYSIGCEDCKETRRVARGKIKINLETHYKNGKPRPIGIYSDENWKKFNALGQSLIDNKKRDK
jgi:hypothetical protein